MARYQGKILPNHSVSRVNSQRKKAQNAHIKGEFEQGYCRESSKKGKQETDLLNVFYITYTVGVKISGLV